ncbi:MAG: hypothetical protein JSS79_15285 [Bacteroidetes bacterium]|nr:hypothetical protein [Bacteroidota bacterium]
MKKLLNAGLLITSLFGYLAWGKEQHAFLFQAEAEVLAKAVVDPMAVMHPFVVLPLLGQLILVVTLFQKEPSRWLSFLGMGCIGVIMAMLLLIGVMGMKVGIALSTVPFLVVGFFVVKANRRRV